jgi:hypothetical protein
LLHQEQCRGQPLKKIFVLTPLPSCNEYLCILKTVSKSRQLFKGYPEHNETINIYITLNIANNSSGG